mmetsp:Transcript_15673/g.27487  ORF Transcript_15673/g.27487 Transcript_15673/m.27487 type:complete len:207 (+) Transcript_15673:906-1526(+)
MLKVPWLEKITSAVSTPQRSPLWVFQKIWIPVILLLCVPIVFLAAVTAQCVSVSSQRQIWPVQQELRPSPRSTTKIQEGGSWLNALKEAYSRCKFLKLLPSSIFMFLSFLAGVGKELITGDTLAQRSSHWRWRLVPNVIKICFCLPKGSDKVWFSMWALKHLLRIGFSQLWLFIKRQRARRGQLEALQLLLERWLCGGAFWSLNLR